MVQPMSPNQVVLAAVLLVCTAACLPTMSLEDAPCPCADGWACCPSTGRCVGQLLDCPDFQGLDRMGGTVAVGADHSCAIREDGRVECWGKAGSPLCAAPTDPMQSISASANFTCGLRVDGTVTCWGLCDESSVCTTPSGTFTSVSTGWYHGCAIRTDGTATCWGDAWRGAASPPTGVFTAIDSGQSYTCGIRADGTITCWGFTEGGRGSAPTGLFKSLSLYQSSAVAINGDDNVLCWGERCSNHSAKMFAVSAGNGFSCGIELNGAPQCWGPDSADLRNAMPQGPFVGISSGSAHVCAQRPDGSLRCWRRNEYSQASPPAGPFKVSMMK